MHTVTPSDVLGKTELAAGDYQYSNSRLGLHHRFLLPVVERILVDAQPPSRRIFDLGCGNGSVADYLTRLGYQVTGVDPSVEGIAQATEHYPELKLHLGSAYDDLAEQFGRFPLVVSLEVVEHLYSPRLYARTVFDLTEPAGLAILSTPYHGYLKNLALALTGKMDNHFTALWDNGHIKFWSTKTLGRLLREAGFDDVRFELAGRIRPLAKSMIAIARRPP